MHTSAMGQLTDGRNSMTTTELQTGTAPAIEPEKKSQRIRNSLIAMAGVIGGQLANFGVMFLIGKNFGPANLGRYSFLVAIALFIGSGIGLRYELACVSRQSESAMSAFIHACALAALLSILLISIAVPIYGGVALAVIAMAFSVFLQNALGFVLNTAERYLGMALVRLMPNLVFLVFLIIASGIGFNERIEPHVFELHALIATLITVASIPWFVVFRNIPRASMGIRFFRENYGFAKYGFPAILLNSCIIYAMPICIPVLYGKEVAGIFALGYRVGMFPVALFTQSIGAVLRRDLLDNNYSKTAFKKVSEYLGIVTLVALLSIGAIYIGIDMLVRQALGGKWKDVIPFFTILAPSFVAAAVFGPISQVFIVFRSQRHEFLLQLASAVAVLLIFASAWQGNFQPKMTASLLSLSTTVFAVLGVLAALRLARSGIAS